MTKLLEWGDSLLDYLHLSNEDERVVSFVTSDVLPVLTRIEDRIDWLEVGPGPGTKTLPIVLALQQVAKDKFRSLRLLEPAQIWRDHLRRNCPALLRLSELSEARFEEYARLGLERCDKWHPNFITCFHVLYDSGLIEEFVRYLQRQQKTGRRMFACVIVEAERSDLFQLRQQLLPLGHVQPCLAAPLLRSSISQLGLPAEEIEVNGQHCKVPDNVEGTDWLLAFLLGCERKTLNELPKKVRLDGSDIIRRFLARKNSRLLEVPDVAFTIRTG
jgi:hypothetical protein